MLRTDNAPRLSVRAGYISAQHDFVRSFKLKLLILSRAVRSVEPAPNVRVLRVLHAAVLWVAFLNSKQGVRVGGQR